MITLSRFNDHKDITNNYITFIGLCRTDYISYCAFCDNGAVCFKSVSRFDQLQELGTGINSKPIFNNNLIITQSKIYNF